MIEWRQLVSTGAYYPIRVVNGKFHVIHGLEVREEIGAWAVWGWTDDSIRYSRISHPMESLEAAKAAAIMLTDLH